MVTTWVEKVQLGVDGRAHFCTWMTDKVHALNTQLLRIYHVMGVLKLFEIEAGAKFQNAVEPEVLWGERDSCALVYWKKQNRRTCPFRGTVPALLFFYTLSVTRTRCRSSGGTILTTNPSWDRSSKRWVESWISCKTRCSIIKYTVCVRIVDVWFRASSSAASDALRQF